MVKEIIKKWKNAGVDHAKFEFSCGGDSMNETNLTFHDKDGNSINDEWGLEDYFNDEIYRKVEFYEASDGHYMGESGNVHIELNENEDDFDYSKSSQSEWSERYTKAVDCPLTQEEYELFDKYIANMRFVSWDGMNVDYKNDFILTDEIEAKIQVLHERFYKFAEEIEYEGNGDVNDDSVEYSTLEDDNLEETPEFLSVDGVKYIKLYCTIEVYEYKDED